MKVYIASDHGGFELKNQIINQMDGAFEFEDLGPVELDMEDDYPVYAIKVAEAVQKNEESLGVLICRSGIGVCITANKFKGIHAANCHTVELAKLSRSHNNANVLCLDADLKSEDHFEILKAFLETPFSNEARHRRRVQMIRDIDDGQIELKDVITDLPIQDLPLNS